MDTIEVELSDTQGHLRIDPSAVVDLARRVLIAEGRRSASISIALVDEASIHALNRVHLSHDWPTDVISFTLSDPDELILAGELVVSAEMAVAAAAEDGVTPRDELALYIVHGLLHLCGYDDSTGADAAEMRRREDEILTQFGYTNPWRVGSGEWGVGSDRIHETGKVAAEPWEVDSGEERMSPSAPIFSPDCPLPTDHSPLLQDRGACP